VSALPKEAPGRQRDLSALPPAIRQKRRRNFWLVALLLAVGLACDWMRPPTSQLSVVLYNTIVIKGYRTFLRPIGNHFIRCPYNPTCSVYSEQAMLTHGFPKGAWLTTSRLFRCMPWVKPGTADPVPEAKRG
jgi:putative membrane protein insertion efficiency factor